LSIVFSEVIRRFVVLRLLTTICCDIIKYILEVYMLRIEMLRKELELSQKEFAKKVNMTQQRISAYEKEKREPDIETIKQFSDFFNVSIDFLLGKTDIRNSKKETTVNFTETLLGMTKEDYENLTDIQKKQIKDFAIYIKNQQN
jgi:transcriptional regulator with XRE-family HTH domain